MGNPLLSPRAKRPPSREAPSASEPNDSADVLLYSGLFPRAVVMFLPNSSRSSTFSHLRCSSTTGGATSQLYSVALMSVDGLLVASVRPKQSGPNQSPEACLPTVVTVPAIA